MPTYHSYRQVTLTPRTYKHSEARQKRVHRVRERLEVLFPMEVALLRRKARVITCPTCSQCGQAIGVK
jgi:hypothetical protein